MLCMLKLSNAPLSNWLDLCGAIDSVELRLQISGRTRVYIVKIIKFYSLPEKRAFPPYIAPISDNCFLSGQLISRSPGISVTRYLGHQVISVNRYLGHQ